MYANIFQRLNELPLSEAARQCLPSCDTPQDFVRCLRDKGLAGDALTVLPHLLPHRVAIWWGCLCVWDAHRLQASEPHLLAMEAIVRWVHLPSEPHRRTCEHFGRALGMNISPGALAMAAFWSGGSMSAPGMPHVPPPAGLAAQVVAGALHLAAVQRDAQHYLDHVRQYLAIGLDVAAGRLLWTPSGTVADRPEHARPPLDTPQVSDRLRVLHSGGHRLHGPHATSPGVGAAPMVQPSLSAYEVLP